ncbi:MAG: glycoside hydrolase family 13 protein [Rudaea sp.]
MPVFRSLICSLPFVASFATPTGFAAGAETGGPAALQSHCTPAPYEATLFLRGSMENWALRDDLALQYHCDAYYLNVAFRGRQEFKIADAAMSRALTFGMPATEPQELASDQAAPLVARLAHPAAKNIVFTFAGAQTIRLVFPLGANSHAGQPTIRIGPKSFTDPDAAPVHDRIARSLIFDSRNANDKRPFGAVIAGSRVHFALSSAAGADSVTLVIERRRLHGPQDVLDYRPVARVPLRRERRAGGQVWRGSYRYAAIGIYGYYFEVRVAGKTYVYENNADTVYWTRELGSQGLGAVAHRPQEASRIRRFRQTVYRADYRVPDWARDLVFYYIFPERFRNGDPSNDPQPGPNTFHDKSVELHRNWLEKPFLPNSGDGSDALYGNDFFGGDLAGITQKLDYIAALGANALYLTPIFRAASNHKYDTADYRNIDPHFGSNDDFVRLARAAKQRGIRIVLDTSLNHSGSDSIYFDRYAKYPQLGAFDGGRIHTDSPYADWYLFDPSQRQPDRQYRGWAGAQDLPELNKASQSYRAFAFAGPDSVMKLWLDRGAAGWRMDVAPWVPDDFWRAWRHAVKGHRPDALTIAETQFDASKYFLGDEFDSTMNYIFRNAVEDYANGASAQRVYRNIELMRENYPPQAFYALMNLLSTHDTARALYDFGDRGDQSDAKAVDLAKQRLRLAAFFQMTFPGAPAVLYGDEVGVTGGEDPFNRVTYPWQDRGGKPDRELLGAYRKLISLRRDHAVLRHGSIDAPVVLDDHLIVLIRHAGNAWAIVAMNNDSVPHALRLPLPNTARDRRFVDALTAARVDPAAGELSFTVPPMFGSVLVSE